MTTVDNPLLADLGIELVDVGPGRASFEIELGARHLNRQGSLQGGVAATMLDAACGYAGLASEDGTAIVGNALTVTLAISYLRKAQSGRLRANGSVTRRGRSLYFATGELVAADSGEVIATAQGAFKRNAESRGS